MLLVQDSGAFYQRKTNGVWNPSNLASLSSKNYLKSQLNSLLVVLAGEWKGVWDFLRRGQKALLVFVGNFCPKDDEAFRALLKGQGADSSGDGVGLSKYNEDTDNEDKDT